LKLEARRRPATNLFFVAWGRTESEAVTLVDQLKANGSLDDRDVAVAGTWTHVDSMPTSRWIRNGGLSRQEHHVLVDEIARVYEHFLAGMSAQTLKKLDEACKEQGIVARSLSDEELIAEMWRGTKQGLLIENFRWLEEVLPWSQESPKPDPSLDQWARMGGITESQWGVFDLNKPARRKPPPVVSGGGCLGQRVLVQQKRASGGYVGDS
jgi:hypothetical protein